MHPISLIHRTGQNNLLWIKDFFFGLTSVVLTPFSNRSLLDNRIWLFAPTSRSLLDVGPFYRSLFGICPLYMYASLTFAPFFDH